MHMKNNFICTYEEGEHKQGSLVKNPELFFKIALE